MDTETVQYNLSTFFLVPEALLRYRVVVVMKLKNCRVPSAANHTFVEAFFPTVVTITTTIVPVCTVCTYLRPSLQYLTVLLT